MTFNHALAWVNFRVKAGNAASKAIAIKGIMLHGAYYAGTFQAAVANYDTTTTAKPLGWVAANTKWTAVSGGRIDSISSPNVVGDTLTSYVKINTSDFKGIGDGILVEYMGCAERVIIPQNVRIIADGAFRNNTYIRTVVAFEGLISIGEYAFSGCSSLMDIHLSKRLEYIGNGAFESCSSLSSVIIPGEIKSIAYQVFENCTSLYKAELGEGIEEIEWSAFNGCSSLQQIRLPDGLKKYVVMLLVIVRP